MKQISQERIDADDFARGVNDAICLARALYRGVDTMLKEIMEELRERQLYRLPVAARSRESPGDKILRSWIGGFYTLEPVAGESANDDESKVDEDFDGGEAKGKINLTAGQDLAFVKVVLFDNHSANDQHNLLISCMACYGTVG